MRVIKYLFYLLFLFSVMSGHMPHVKKAAETFRDFCYSYRDQLMAGIIVAGWDPKQGGQVIN